MIREYIDAAMRKARDEIIEEDKTFYGEIPECKGVWANNKTLEACRTELESVLEDWLLIGISEHHKLPSLPKTREQETPDLLYNQYEIPNYHRTG